MWLLGWILFWLAAAAAAEPEIDVGALIAKRCGPAGYQLDSGCTVALGDGSFEVSETISLGGCSTATVRNSVILQGSSAGLMTTVPRFPTAGTTLRWTGPAGGTMIDVCGASFLSLRDFTLDARGAGVGVKISADNAASAISHFVNLRDLVIDGAEIGIYVTGRRFADQSDFVTLERVSIGGVGVGYLQDSQQSVGGKLQTVEVVARKKGFEIRNGSLHCDGCYVGTAGEAGPDFIAFHLTRGSEAEKPWEAHHQVAIEHSHMELQQGRFVVEDAGALFPISLIGNSYSLQCRTPGCEMRVLDSRSRGPVVMIAEAIQASSAMNPKARICHQGGELERIGVFRKPEVAALEWSCPGPVPAPPPAQ